MLHPFRRIIRLYRDNDLRMDEGQVPFTYTPAGWEPTLASTLKRSS